MSAVSAGLETKDNVEEIVLLMNTFIRLVFTVDVCCRLIAEPYCWKYFIDDWNKFDVLIVLVSWIPVAAVGGKYLVALKMLRLLRLLKIVKRFKTLKIILSALSSSTRSIIMICGLMFLIMTLIAAIGHSLFRENDPAHFGNIRVGFLTMFQVLTLDSWSLLMYINMYGCDIIGYDDWPEKCVSPKARFIVSALFFTASVATLTWVMVTMFIGLLTTGMEESLLKRKKLEEVEMKVRRVLYRWKRLHSRDHLSGGPRNLKRLDIVLLRRAFNFLDFSKRGAIGRVEVFFAFEISGLAITSDEFNIFWKETRKQNPNVLDFSEFLTIIFHVRDLAMKSKTDMHHEALSTISNSFDLNSNCESFGRIDENEPDIVSVWTFEGKKYLRSKTSNAIYDFRSSEESDERQEIGFWDESIGRIIFHEQEVTENLPLQNFALNLLFGEVNDNSTYCLETVGIEKDAYTCSDETPREDASENTKTLMSPLTGFSCIIPNLLSSSKVYGDSFQGNGEKDVPDVVKKFEFEGKIYLRSKSTGKIYPSDCPDGTDERLEIGYWDSSTESIVFHKNMKESDIWTIFKFW